MSWKSWAMNIALMAAAGIAAIALTLLECRGDEITQPKPDTISTKIVLPMTPVLVEPNAPPAPEPTVEPRIIGTIKPDEWYVVESAIELIALQSPDGLLSIESTSGPIKVRGKFSDGTGKTETREYRSPYVYFITAEKTGTTELILVPVGVLDAKEIVRQVLTVSGLGPNPPPAPDPDDPVVPDPPGPVTPAKLQIVIIEDPALRGSLPASQIAVMDGSEVRDYTKTHCVLTDGHPDFRKLSFRQDVSGQPDWIKNAFAQPRPSMPFLVVMTPSKIVAGPLPATVDETMTLLKSYGGP